MGGRKEQATFILINSPLAPEDFPLASIVFDRTEPKANPEDKIAPYKVTGEDISRNKDENFNDSVRSHSNMSVQGSLSQFLRATFGKKKSSGVRITAPEGYMYTLKDPRKLFKKVIASLNNENKTCIEEAFGENLRIWFVIGFRTLVDATLSKESHRDGNLSVAAAAPIPGTEIAGLSSVGASASHTYSGHNESGMKTPGERIYAVRYRKIHVKTAKGSTEFLLQHESAWKMIDATLGRETDYIEYIMTELEDVDGDEDCDLYFVGNEGQLLGLEHAATATFGTDTALDSTI